PTFDLDRTVPRLFLGLDLPDPIDFDLQLLAGGVPGARWQQADQLHLTLHFLDEVDGGSMRRLIAALGELQAPAFTMQLRGAGMFPPRGQPRTLWVGIAEADPVRLLHQRSARIIDDLGIDREHRKFQPHVTVARLGRTSSREAMAWVTGHMLYSCEPFVVDRVLLYSSVLASKGARYQVEAEFLLDSP
ncbi:MAG: RNA 2',3'-cyclic phosphodiesterase, partial [Myxococcales bacterium]|nr:RNA 2',3'-cyclic phosphodiesterase [Myxococcales bacterium]